MGTYHTPEYGYGFRTLSLPVPMYGNGIRTEYGENPKYVVQVWDGDRYFFKNWYGHEYGY